MTTVAAIDRVVHHSVVLDLMGLESYRAKAATSAHQAVSLLPDEAQAHPEAEGERQPTATQ